ncbi:TniQ family protein [Streptomyces aidingensis]|uniref:TniQ family protein n=1 Tax=Streptomyces aidingensis TaxID=910347 RepID=UPI0015879749|nr:TniQ family protein [Streptomyces aidingensis]
MTSDPPPSPNPPALASPGRLAPAPRRLPAVPSPLPGESLFSWVDHLAAELDIPRGEAMRALGLESATSHAWQLGMVTSRMTVSQACAVEKATGLDRRALEAMIFEDVVPGQVPPPRPRLVNRLKQLTAFCPSCLLPPGRWPLWWGEPWAVMCPLHQRYLVSVCPACLSPFAPVRLLSRARGRCCELMDNLNTTARKRSGRCGQLLWACKQPTVTDPLLPRLHDRLVQQFARREQDQDVRVVWQLVRACGVRVFDTPDAVLRDCFPAGGADREDLRRNSTGFLQPHHAEDLGPIRLRRRGVGDAVTTAAELRVVAQILFSSAPERTARELLEQVRQPLGVGWFPKGFVENVLPGASRRLLPLLWSVLKADLAARVVRCRSSATASPRR